MGKPINENIQNDLILFIVCCLETSIVETEKALIGPLLRKHQDELSLVSVEDQMKKG